MRCCHRRRTARPGPGHSVAHTWPGRLSPAFSFAETTLRFAHQIVDFCGQPGEAPRGSEALDAQAQAAAKARDRFDDHDDAIWQGRARGAGGDCHPPSSQSRRLRGFALDPTQDSQD
jgi:hypothetical protein